MTRTGIGLVATASALAVAGCGSAHHGARRSNTEGQPAVPVVYVTAIRSPDGKLVAVVTHDRSALEVGPATGGKRRTIYRATTGGISTDVYWVSPRVIVFGSGFDVSRIDVRTRRVRRIIRGPDSFNVSPDGRLIAWTVNGGAEGRDSVGIVSITGANCRAVARPANASDSLAFFKPGVKRLFFLRELGLRDGASGPDRIISAPLSGLRPCR